MTSIELEPLPWSSGQHHPAEIAYLMPDYQAVSPRLVDRTYTDTQKSIEREQLGKIDLAQASVKTY